MYDIIHCHGIHVRILYTIILAVRLVLEYGYMNTAFTGENAKSEQAYLYIRDLIMRNELKAGQKIAEEEIAAKLATSRTPVREALRRLSADGLVTIRPRSYAEVTVFSKDMICQMGYVRLALDILSGQLAIHMGSNADFQEISKLSDICNKAFSDGELYSAIVADRDFHLAITAISKNNILMLFNQANYLRLHLMQLQYAGLTEHSKRENFHEVLIDCLNRRDSAALTAEITDRYSAIYGLEPKIIEPYKAAIALRTGVQG